ncbi:MAG: site-specific DNA-methyltransferase [Clostridiales Family XIII bacterium]|jgi:DNA modification methylase|nr:site-specific DNA-methyltransferase [Clostridiales Family XIII bacterium]
MTERIPNLRDILETGYEAWEKAAPAELRVAEICGAARADLPENKLLRADNLGVMKSCARDGQAGAFDLIYADPPFFSRSNYGADIKLKSASGNTLPALRRDAYNDAWDDDPEAYLRMLVPRFFGFRELLSRTGCLWVHLDWHAVHCVKILLDAIFGEENLVNEVIWNYKSGGVSRRRFARKHDTLLFYAKTKEYYFKPQKEKSYNRGLKPYRFKGVKEYRDEVGWYTLVNMKDVWQLDMVGRTSAERTGYATQKPEALIARILESCTREGDLCADFFAGSGTLAAAAERMGRRWLLCDSGRFAAINAQKRMLNLGAAFSVLTGAGGGANGSEASGGGGSGEAVAGEAGDFEAECRAERTVDPGKTRVTLRLLRCGLPAGSAVPVDARNLPLVEAALREDPLLLVDYWSADFSYDGELFRPRICLCRDAGGIVDRCESLLQGEPRVAVRVVDIFGNESFRKVESTAFERF